MTAPRLSRAADGRPAPPVRLLHLGLGNFFLAHQAWYTEHAADAPSWGYAAFAGRRAAPDRALAEQGGCYTLVQRGPEADRDEVVSSLCTVRGAADHAAWAGMWSSAGLAAVTVTVTEAGYRAAPGGGLDPEAPDVAADVARLRADPCGPAASAPGRLVAGLAARRRSGAGPVALVPCDNLPGNGELGRRVVLDLAERVDPALAGWIAASTSVVGTVVDRITPRATAADADAVTRRTGRIDRAVVVTEPFAEWVLAGDFPAGRPRWEAAGARFVDDTTPYEHRKLWLLNGAHSLLAYAGSARGWRTVAEALADDACRRWVEDWWDEASSHLAQPAGELAGYRRALAARFANPRMADPLARVAEDGSQKLPVRVLPVVRAERAAGRVPAAGARILAAWIGHLRGGGAPVRDVRQAELTALAAGPLARAVPAVLGALDPAAAEDGELVGAVTDAAGELGGTP